MNRVIAFLVLLITISLTTTAAATTLQGLYWHKGKSGGTSLVQKSPTPPPAPAPDTPKKGLRRRTTLSKKEKKKLEEDAQKARELQNSPQIGRETNAQPVQEERMWLVDTERLTAYPDLYMTDVLPPPEEAP